MPRKQQVSRPQTTAAKTSVEEQSRASAAWTRAQREGRRMERNMRQVEDQVHKTEKAVKDLEQTLAQRKKSSLSGSGQASRPKRSA